MIKRVAQLTFLLLIGAATWFGAQYVKHSVEDSDLTATVRISAGGQYVATPMGTVHYELAGPPNGRTVVLIHGFSVPYYLWDVPFNALVAGGYRVLRYDLFGRGFSDRPEGAYDGAFYDRQLMDLLNTLHIDGQVDVMGASLGGPIAARFACRHPERVRTVSFFDPGFSHGQPMPFMIRTPILGEYQMAVNIAPNLPQAQLADFVHPENHPDWPARFRPQMRYRGFRRALLQTLRNHLPEDWSKDYVCLGKGATPVLLIWGKADHDVPFSLSQEVRSVLPSSEFVAVDDAAHVPFIEHPEIVNPVILSFLARH